MAEHEETLVNTQTQAAAEPPPEPLSEPWMRGTHEHLDPLRRGVIHALELAVEDAQRWCAGLSEQQLFAVPYGLPPVAFHLRHIARSLDRLLTYAEGRSLTADQFALLHAEGAPGTSLEVLTEFMEGLTAARTRIEAIASAIYAQRRGIGRKQLPTTVAGLLIHCAEHTQRHTGQMVTTAKVLRSMDPSS